MAITKRDMYTSDDVRVRHAHNIARTLCEAKHGYGTERASVCWPCQEEAMEMVNDYDTITASAGPKGGALMSKGKWLPLGSISHGTLKLEDLIPAVISLAEEVELSERDKALSIGWQRDYDQLLSSERIESEEAMYLYEEIVDTLDQYAAPYTYLGALEGDGADIGVWIDEESLGMAMVDGEVHSSADLPSTAGWDVLDSAKYWLHAQTIQHRTLYDKWGTVLWEVM